MTPDASLVADLHAFDSRLRIRWAPLVEKWFIERKLEMRNPQLTREMPAPDTSNPIRRELYESWKEGYVHVLTVPNELCHWRFIVPELSRMDSWRAGSMQKIADELDAKEDQRDAADDKRIDNWAAAASRDAHDHIGWFEKRTVSMHQPDSTPYTDSGQGFLVRDRRRDGE